MKSEPSPTETGPGPMKSGPSPAKTGPGPVKSGPSPAETGRGRDVSVCLSLSVLRFSVEKRRIF